MSTSMVLLSLQYCFVLSEYMNIRILKCMGECPVPERGTSSSEDEVSTTLRGACYRGRAEERTTDRTALRHYATRMSHLGSGS